jgi:MFS family permease
MDGRVLERRLTAIGITGLLVFLVAVIAEHIAKPSLDPATHEISEYVHTPLGWLMTAGFVAWAASLVATGVLVDRWRMRTVSVAMLAAAVGMAITASFATQTSAGRLPRGVAWSVAGRLHNFGSGLTTLALLAAVLLSLRVQQRPKLRRLSLLLLALALPADLILLVLGSDVAGIRQRVLVAIGCTWQLCLLKSKTGENHPSDHR